MQAMGKFVRGLNDTARATRLTIRREEEEERQKENGAKPRVVSEGQFFSGSSFCGSIFIAFSKKLAYGFKNLDRNVANRAKKAVRLKNIFLTPDDSS